MSNTDLYYSFLWGRVCFVFVFETVGFFLSHASEPWLYTLLTCLNFSSARQFYIVRDLQWSLKGSHSRLSQFHFSSGINDGRLLELFWLISSQEPFPNPANKWHPMKRNPPAGDELRLHRPAAQRELAVLASHWLLMPFYIHALVLFGILHEWLAHSCLRLWFAAFPRVFKKSDSFAIGHIWRLIKCIEMWWGKKFHYIAWEEVVEIFGVSAQLVQLTCFANLRANLVSCTKKKPPNNQFLHWFYLMFYPSCGQLAVFRSFILLLGTAARYAPTGVNSCARYTPTRDNEQIAIWFITKCVSCVKSWINW